MEDFCYFGYPASHPSSAADARRAPHCINYCRGRQVCRSFFPRIRIKLGLTEYTDIDISCHGQGADSPTLYLHRDRSDSISSKFQEFEEFVQGPPRVGSAKRIIFQICINGSVERTTQASQEMQRSSTLTSMLGPFQTLYTFSTSLVESGSRWIRISHER